MDIGQYNTFPDVISIDKMGDDTSWSEWCPKWCPTSEELLAEAENKMFEGINVECKRYFVCISKGNKIRTVETSCKSNKLPLVILHGFASGVGLWVLNLDELSQNQKVYAIDLLGFGRSSRPQFPCEEAEAEDYFVKSIEEWRQGVGLEKFILLGHGFGGYLAASYTLAHPDRIRHLVLADPWGMSEKTPADEEKNEMPMWIKCVATVFSLFNPLAVLRASGPLGPTVLRNFRPDMLKKFTQVFDKNDTRVLDYLYHVNAQVPSGEAAFMSLAISYGWAKYPMMHRVKYINTDIPISILFGSRSWMDIASSYTIKYLRPTSYVKFQTIKGGGHHIYADKADEFNEAVDKICDDVYCMRDVFYEQAKNEEEEVNFTPETYDSKNEEEVNFTPETYDFCSM